MSLKLLFEGGSCFYAWYGVWLRQRTLSPGSVSIMFNSWTMVYLLLSVVHQPKVLGDIDLPIFPWHPGQAIDCPPGGQRQVMVCHSPLYLIWSLLQWWSKTIGNAVWSTFEAKNLFWRLQALLKFGTSLIIGDADVSLAGWFLLRWGGESSWPEQSWRNIVRKRRCCSIENSWHPPSHAPLPLLGIGSARTWRSLEGDWKTP